MTVQTFTSDHARSNWRDLLDLAATGETDVVIERHGKPTAALIGFEAYQAMQVLLDELRALQRAERAMQEWLEDPSIGISYAALRAEMLADGVFER
jgi:prevent-host-death family protein